jgi:hypothetical protein
MLLSLTFDLRLHGANDFLTIESEREGLRDKTFGRLGKFGAEGPLLGLCALRDERSASSLRRENAGSFEFGIRAIDGVGIDRQGYRDFTNRRQLVTHHEQTARDCVQDLIPQLQVYRNAGFFVEAEFIRIHCPIVLRH